MPYPRPLISALYAQAQQDITASALPGADGTLAMSVLNVMALVEAGLVFELYDYLDWISKQGNPWSATAEYAAAWAALKGVFQKDATTAGLAPSTPGTATFTGSVTAPLPAGSPMRRGDGVAFVTTADATVGSGNTVTAPVAAVLPGSSGNTGVGAIMTLSPPVQGINAGGTCTAAITGGAPIEDFDAFKARYLQQYASPSQGGDKSDYIEWALAIPGVTRAWVLPNGFGPGTVVIYTMWDVAEARTGGFPVGVNGVATGETRDTQATGDQLTVANSILPLQPVTALVYSVAPNQQTLDFTFSGLSPNTAAVQAGIAAALADMFVRLDQVGGTVDPVTGLPWGTLFQSDWESAIASVAGIQNFTVAAPILPVTPAPGSLLTLGALTFPSS